MFIGSSLCKKSFTDHAAETILKDAEKEALDMATHNMIDETSHQVKGGLTIKMNNAARSGILRALCPEIINKALDRMIRIYTP